MMTQAVASTVVSTVSNVVAMFTLNPLEWLGGKAKETLADGFTSMMMGLWSAAMWLLQTAFNLIDDFIPNVADPDLGKLYSVTLWISLAIALVIAFGQIGLAVLRQDGRGFGTLAAGLVQYGLVVACWVGVSAGLIVACSGLSQAILKTLLGVDSFSGYAAGDGFVDTVSGTVQAATLGVCALFVVIPAAFGNIIIMLVRSTALLILTATLPITAAGAMSDGSKSWMWKSIRWFLACCLMDPMLALVLGIGTQFAWAGLPDGAAADGSSSAENIGMSVVGSLILLVACFMPMVLFRLLAFVDPGTASGASFRSTMNANGGVAGLLRGKSGQVGGVDAGSGSAAASQTAPDGRTTGEAGAEAETATRWQSSKIGKTAAVVAAGMERTGQVAQAGAGMGVDVLGQSGIGNQGYYDTSHSPRSPQARGPGPQGGVSGRNGKGVANDSPPEVQATVDEREIYT
ncbi:hypothetical protein CF8_0930 [Nocardioides sp. CF8]|nr:hypothetical protein CF8_0930 [Nocardioides sp. CF8]